MNSNEELAKNMLKETNYIPLFNKWKKFIKYEISNTHIFYEIEWLLDNCTGIAIFPEIMLKLVSRLDQVMINLATERVGIKLRDNIFS